MNDWCGPLIWRFVVVIMLLSIFYRLEKTQHTVEEIRAEMQKAAPPDAAP